MPAAACARAGDQSGELLAVQVLVGDAEQVAGRAGLDRVHQAGAVEHLAQRRDTRLDLGPRGGRRGVAPHRVDELLHGDDPVRPQRQDRQDNVLPRPADLDLAVPRDEFQGTENP